MNFFAWRFGRQFAAACDESLAEHDKKYHPNGFDPDIETCNKRAELAKADKGDVLSPNEGSENRREKPLVSAAEDAAYMDAVKRGDMETAANMVREVAGRAFPNTKVVGEDGKPKIVYHGGELKEIYGGEIYTSDDKNLVKGYGKTYSLFANITNPKVIDADGNMSDDLYGETLEDENAMGVSTDRVVSDTMYDPNSNHDGVIFRNVVDNATGDADGLISDVFVPFNMEGSQIKSADPVTYDDDGNVIPLSRRFDEGNDIRGDVSGGAKKA